MHVKIKHPGVAYNEAYLVQARKAAATLSQMGLILEDQDEELPEQPETTRGFSSTATDVYPSSASTTQTFEFTQLNAQSQLQAAHINSQSAVGQFSLQQQTNPNPPPNHLQLSSQSVVPQTFTAQGLNMKESQPLNAISGVDGLPLPAPSAPVHLDFVCSTERKVPLKKRSFNDLLQLSSTSTDTPPELPNFPQISSQSIPDLPTSKRFKPTQATGAFVRFESRTSSNAVPFHFVRNASAPAL